MTTEQIKASGKCCITDKPLNTSQYINMVTLAHVATWEFPRSGNFTDAHKGLAVAFVHDDAITAEGKLIGEVKYAVEFKNEEILYHEVSSLDKANSRSCRVCGCTDTDCRQCIEAQGFPCHWMEDDLCSRCYNEKHVELIEYEHLHKRNRSVKPKE